MQPKLQVFRHFYNITWGTLFPEQIDLSTEPGRARERHRRLALSGISALCGKFITVLTTLISVPLTLHYLGSERYGLWLTISSLISMLGFADLGIGNGLLTAIARAHGRDDEHEAQRVISSAFLMLSSVAILLSLLFFAIYPFVNWPKLLHVTTKEAAGEAGPAILVFFCCFAANLPLDVIGRVLMGYQDGWKANLWGAAGNLCGLFCVILAWYFKAGLPWLVLGLAGAPTVVMLFNGMILFGIEKPHLRPQLALASKTMSLNLLHSGFWFLLLNVAGSIAFVSDNIIIDQVLGPKSIPNFAVPFRLFGVPLMFLSMVLSPLWPAYGEAFARGDVSWLKRTLWRSIRMTLAFTIPATLFLAVFNRQIIHLWLGTTMPLSIFFIAGLCVWSLISSLGNAVAMLLNGLHVLRFQVLLGFLLAFAKIVLSVIALKSFGVDWLIWSTVLAYVICVAIPLIIFLPRMLQKLQLSGSDDPMLPV